MTPSPAISAPPSPAARSSTTSPPYDKVIVIRRNGIYTAMTVPEKFFVDKGVLYFGSAEKEELAKILFTIVYRDGETAFPTSSAAASSSTSTTTTTSSCPTAPQILLFSTDEDFEFTVVYEPKNRG